MIPDARLASQLSPCPMTGCWLWTGSLNRNGYGRLSVGGRTRVTHRVVWVLLGLPLESTQVLDHLCRVRSCCNPAHLEPVTVRENTRRGDAVLFKKV